MAQVDLAYDVLGDGPPLVLLHGITENRRAWDPIPLNDHYRVVRVDLRGHGASPGEDPYDLPTLARDVHAVVEKEATEPPIVVGHSMGAAIATTYGSLFPVRGVVNVDQSLALVELQAQIQQAVPLLRGDGLNEFVEAMFGQVYGALDSAEVARLSALRQVNREAVLGMWSPLLDLSPEELGALIERVSALPPGTPYLALHGLDPGPNYAAWLTALIPDATVEIWDDVPTHYPHLVDPERFVRRIREFAG